MAIYLENKQTPPVIRYLIWITASTILIVAGADQLFHQLLNMRGPLDFFGLSWYGVRHYYIWQPFTYMFTQEAGPQGITFLFLIALFLNMYLLWLIGSMLVERIGQKKILILYFASGIVAGIATLFSMQLLDTYSIVSSPTAAIIALCVVWTMFYPDSELTFAYLFPIQARWLLAGALGALIILCITQWDILSLIFYFTAVVFGYLYGIIALGLRGPFDFSKGLDKRISAYGQSVKSKLVSKKYYKDSGAKIVDITSGTTKLDDETFIDAMLTKIIKHGEKSLTRSERRRMDDISAKKAKKKEEG